MSKFFITNRQKEQAERMAAKWEARAEAFYTDGEGWGLDTAGYCKTMEQADQAQTKAMEIYESIARLSSGCGEWPDVQIIRAAVAGRDELDAGLQIKNDLAR